MFNHPQSLIQKLKTMKISNKILRNIKAKKTENTKKNRSKNEFTTIVCFSDPLALIQLSYSLRS